jgi:2-amino-4-hydroxy-6-hydroxymethyldihydropteridine diphosphokinase
MDLSFDITVKKPTDKPESGSPEIIYIALGANLPSPRTGSPRQTLEAALRALEAAGFRMLARSRWYRSAPVPASDQPDYVNGVAAGHWALSPEDTLGALHRIERDFGRVRGLPNAARLLDLDLIAYGARVSEGGAVLPHPRMRTRGFVLLPLRELAPDWRHPATGEPIGRLIAALPPDQRTEVMD